MRNIEKDDYNFIYNSFLLTVREALPSSMIPKNIYFKEKAKEIENILNSSTTVIASQPDFPEIIYGYSIFRKFLDNTIIHFIYVKANFRKLGIMTDLLSYVNIKDQLVITSQVTKNLLSFKRKYPNLIYDPYITEKIIRNNLCEEFQK